MSMHEWNPAEQLVAEQAVMAYRAVLEASREAEHGHGMEAMESALLSEGREHLRRMLEQAAGTHEEAQKKGSVPNDASAGAIAGSRAGRARR